MISKTGFYVFNLSAIFLVIVLISNFLLFDKYTNGRLIPDYHQFENIVFNLNAIEIQLLQQ